TTPGFVVATATIEDGGIAAYRLRFALREEGGRWLVSDVQEGGAAMAVVTRRRAVRVLMVVAAGFPLLLASGAALLTVVMGGTCTGSGVGDAPSALAIRVIPASFLRIYEQVGAQF